MQTDHLMADRTFRVERVKSLPSKELYELDNPHGKDTHGRLVVITEFGIPQQLNRNNAVRTTAGVDAQS
jgi:hypothetical protein